MRLGKSSFGSFGRWLRGSLVRSTQDVGSVSDVSGNRPSHVSGEDLRVSWTSCRPLTAHSKQGIEISLQLPAAEHGEIVVTQHEHCLSVTIAGVDGCSAAESSLRRTIPVPSGDPWKLVDQAVRDRVLILQLKHAELIDETPPGPAKDGF